MRGAQLLMELVALGSLTLSVVLGIIGHDEAALPLAWLAGISFIMAKEEL